MTDRPILMSAPMVRACLDGTKTQTRRGLYLPRLAEDGVVPNKFSIYHGRNAQGVEVACDPPALTLDDHIGRWWAINPLVKLVPGDRLWVREAWRPLGDGPLSECTGPADVTFMATDDEALVAQCNYRPSIHMPKWASRLTLTITGRKVERLQSISHHDALAEGVAGLIRPDGHPHHAKIVLPGEGEGTVIGRWFEPTPRDAYESLWEYLNGPDSWVANPWVIVLTFTAEHRNIEEIDNG